MQTLEELAVASTQEHRSRFRRAVSLFATGIAVVTVRGETISSVHGVTINSFSSISLDPPTILISLRPGRTHRLISEHGRFGVSILHDQQKSCSVQFSGRSSDDFVPDFSMCGDVPVLSSHLACFECEVVERVEIHDHTLFIARVVTCEATSGAPLLFFASQYHTPQHWSASQQG